MALCERRHPASGYVQGINDLVTPFLAVFLLPHMEGAMGDETETQFPEEVCCFHFPLSSLYLLYVICSLLIQLKGIRKATFSPASLHLCLTFS